jgi:glycosyltransferase involved in cell wall biosynthesis
MHVYYLQDALESLAAQTLDRWEVIIINDTGQPLTRLPSYAIVCETPKASSGPAIARNIGVRLASAPLLLFLDADDYLVPSALEQMLAVYKEQGGYVYSDFIQQETGKHIKVTMGAPEDILHKLPHAVTCLVPKSAFDAVGGFDTTLEAWEDWDFYIAINVAGYYGNKATLPLFYYRMDSGTRRESQYAQRDAYKKSIYDKWHAYIEGEQKFMPCSGCGKKKAVQLPTVQSQARTRIQSPEGEAVLIEFVPNGVAPVTYRGQVTGTLYRFGSDVGHKRKYVYTVDVPYLLARKEFKRAATEVTDPILATA